MAIEPFDYSDGFILSLDLLTKPDLLS